SRPGTGLFTVPRSPPPPTPTNKPLPTPTPGPTPPACNTSMPVTLSLSFGPHGTFVTAQGCGWTPGSQVVVSWDNAEPLTSTTVHPDGTFTVSFAVPEHADKGPHQMVFSQSCGGGCVSRGATPQFTVTEG